MIDKLIRISDHFDKIGREKEADYLDKIIKISSDNNSIEAKIIRLAFHEDDAYVSQSIALAHSLSSEIDYDMFYKLYAKEVIQHYNINKYNQKIIDDSNFGYLEIPQVIDEFTSGLTDIRLGEGFVDQELADKMSTLSSSLIEIAVDFYEHKENHNFSNKYILENIEHVENYMYKAYIGPWSYYHCPESGEEMASGFIEYDYDKKEFVDIPREDWCEYELESLDILNIISEIKLNAYSSFSVDEDGNLTSNDWIDQEHEIQKISFLQRYKFDPDDNMPVDEAIALYREKYGDETYLEDDEGDVEYEEGSVQLDEEKMEQLGLGEDESDALEFMLSEEEFNKHAEKYAKLRDSGYSWDYGADEKYLEDNPIFKRFLEVASEQDSCGMEDINRLRYWTGYMSKHDITDSYYNLNDEDKQKLEEPSELFDSSDIELLKDRLR